MGPDVDTGFEAVDKLMDELASVDEELSQLEDMNLKVTEGRWTRRMLQAYDHRMATGTELSTFQVREELDRYETRLWDIAQRRDKRAVLEDRLAYAVLGESDPSAVKDIDIDQISSWAKIGLRVGGIHAAQTWVVEAYPGVFDHDPSLSDTKAVLKKVKGEALSEMCAYELSEALGFRNVPEVRRINWDRDGEVAPVFGHLMRWTDHAGEAGASAMTGTGFGIKGIKKLLNDDPEMRHEWMKLQILDVLLVNIDRHMGNAVIDPDAKKIWAIDNGYGFQETAFFEEKLTEDIFIERLEAGDSSWGITLSLTQEDVTYVEGLLAHMRENVEQIREAVARRYRGRNGGDFTIGLFNRRLDQLLSLSIS